MASDPHARMSTSAHRFFQDRAMRPPNVAESLIIQAVTMAVQEEMAREMAEAARMIAVTGQTSGASAGVTLTVGGDEPGINFEQPKSKRRGRK